ncbi:Fur family transcriptional regulator [Streptoalloteichus hindustanus]|uniref:Zinc uptake regulator, Fur family n=1 Tax=Streptoalloteichus hindustanus TaxID=2017 RepID=A0A1M5BIC9_STRHI|nr:Fur family transcriptional regulator [Streptoalloteichus hindustanus]SHF41972.1 zinc uptake regulator, Fur family [Streptoalloteichus hindustanus]
MSTEHPTTGQRSTTAVPGLRATRQRAAVSRLLDQLDDFRSAQEIHEELRRRGEGIGLTTVYRTLQTLADAGEVDVLRTGTGEAIYRRCSAHHHHHLVCRGCGRTVEVEGPAVEKWADRVAAENGFTHVSHTVEIFGTCADCGSAPEPSAS